MRIKILSGPAAGQIRHAEKTQATQLLIDTGLAELVIEPPPAAPKVSWGIHRGRETQRPAIIGRCNREVCGMVRFEGRPEHAHLTVFTHSCSATPPEKAPAEVLNAYVAAVKEDQGTFSPDEGNMLEFACSKGDSGKRRPLFQGYGMDGKPIYEDPWW
jgi:hypothetical protein